MIVTNILYPNLNANSEIAYRIGRALRSDHGCDVTIMGYHKTAKKTIPPDPDGMKTVSIRAMTDFQRIFLTTPNRWIRLAKLAVRPRSMRLYFAIRSGNLYGYSDSYLSAIREEIKKESYDCILGFSEPPSVLVALSRMKEIIPFISYRLDPWATNILYSGSENIRNDELRSDSAAAAIIVTDLIRRDCEKYSTPEILKKMIPLEFPNILRQKLSKKAVSFEPGKTHCVYTGVLYKDIRNPSYTVSLFGNLSGDGIVFHIFGLLSSDDLLPNPLPENVIYHGSVDSDTALACMQAADVLVSIGNTIANQMPSKILTYISLGKPILNLVKTPECPTLPYLKKYPAALNITETNTPLPEDVERAREFIQSSRGLSIPFEEIEKMYETCTPAYVGQRVYDIISKVVEEANGRK